MKREAVQEERQRAAKGQEESHPNSSVQVITFIPDFSIRIYFFVNLHLCFINRN